MINNIQNGEQVNIAKTQEIVSALKLLHDFGIINQSSVEESMNKHIQSILSQHPYSIYQGKDGRWATYVKDDTNKSGRRKIVKPTREQLNTALFEHYTKKVVQSSLAKLTLESFFPMWIEDKKDEVSCLTIQRYQSDWNRFYKNSDMVKIPIIELDRLTLKRWIKKVVIDNKLTRKQFYNMAVILNQSLDLAVEEGIIPSNPFTAISLKRDKYFTPEKKKTKEEEVFIGNERIELEKLALEEYYSGVKKYEFAPLAVIFLKRTGIRIGELCALRYDDLNDDSFQVRRFFSKNLRQIIDNPKGSFGERHVPLDKKAIEVLSIIEKSRKERGIPLEGYIFSTSGKPLSYRAVSDSLKKYCKQMNTINKPPHKLRKTAITDWHNAGYSDYTIQQWAGHKDSATTHQSYIRDTTSTEELLNRLNDIP